MCHVEDEPYEDPNVRKSFVDDADSVTQQLKRKRERSRRNFRKFISYAGTVLMIGLIAGCCQAGMGVFQGVRVEQSLYMIIRTTFGSVIGLLFGAVFLIQSLIKKVRLPKDGTVMLLPVMGIVCAGIGTFGAAISIDVDDRIHFSIAASGVCGTFTGVALAAFRYLYFEPHRS